MTVIVVEEAKIDNNKILTCRGRLKFFSELILFTNINLITLRILFDGVVQFKIDRIQSLILIIFSTI